MILGAVGIAAAVHFAETGVASIVLVLGSLAYVAWMTGRGTAIALAILSTSLQLLRAEQPVANEVVAVAGLWFVLYLVVVLLTAAIEAATRPDT